MSLFSRIQKGEEKASRTANSTASSNKVASLPAVQMVPEQESMLQAKFAITQRMAPEEEVPLQGKFQPVQFSQPDEEGLLQGKFMPSQLARAEEEEPLQGKFQFKKEENKTGMPDVLKSGIENLSGFNMDDVKVHYNSQKPAQLNALAYAQGTDIHIGPGQEKHLSHEAWHVAQQKQGRVQATMQLNEGVPVNDDARLEQEADIMGARAIRS